MGSAGGANKCAFLGDIGVDHVIDYKATSNLTEALLRATPNGIGGYAMTSSCGKRPWSKASKTHRFAFLKLFKGENFGKMLVKLA